MTTAAVTEAWWSEVVGAADVVIVGICTPASGPCRGFSTVVDELRVELTGVASVVSVDLETHPEVARRYDVSSLPTLLIFRTGALVGRLIGARSKERLFGELSPYLS